MERAAGTNDLTLLQRSAHSLKSNARDLGAMRMADMCQAIETTLIRYSTGLDTFDAEMYASAFTEDAEFTMGNKVYKGRAEIGKIITDMKADRAKRAADADKTNDPPPSMHHVLTNAVIDIVSADKATHRAYWMTVNGGPAMYSFRVAAQGRYEDELVKRNGQWLIHRRKILD